MFNIGTIIDKIVPDADTRYKLKHEIERQEFEGQKAQLEVNAVEAAHASRFVAGWRPGMGWVCVLAFGSNYIFLPIMNWSFTVVTFFTGKSGFPELTPFDTTALMPILLGMLGLGGLRTYEKKAGVANSIFRKFKK